MGNFYKPIQCQNTTKTKYGKSKTAVTGECGNNAKATGMAGIWSGAFTRRQLWGGGRESRSGEWELHGSLPATALMTHPLAHTHVHTYTLMHNTQSQQTRMPHTHTREIIKGDLQQLKASADSQGLCPWLQEAKTGDRRTEGGRGRLNETEKEREVRGVPEQDCTLNSNSDQRLHSKHRAMTESWDYSYTTSKLYINTYDYI